MAEFAGVDLVRRALEQPIDWEKFEQLVCELLAQDDLPRLRKLGGRGDLGMDAVDEAFYENESRTSCVVQITSQKAQVEKFANTVTKLRTAGLSFNQLIMVYRQPVESAVRREIQAKALEYSIAVDPRDGEYLVRHLGRPNGIFARYFGTLRDQVEVLLNTADPLAVAPDRVHRAMLASLGAYVAHPKARMARRTLFDKAVIAALVAQGGDGTTLPALVAALKILFPEEIIDLARVNAAVLPLREQGLCTVSAGVVRPSQEALSSVGQVLAQTQTGFSALVDHVIGRITEATKLDDATRGYVERNLRRAMVHVLRSQGPLLAEEGLGDAYDYEGVLACLAESVGESVARRSALALHEYTVDPRNSAILAPLVRSYAALAIRNMDPLGRRWQKMALGRSEVVLDTDALLVSTVDELPESPLLRGALLALAEEGVKITIPESVFAEAIGHVERAPRTHRKFQGRLHRMSPDAVDKLVWHAVVQGYYYAHRKDNRHRWEDYFAKYYDSKNSRRYFEYVVRKRLPSAVIADVEVSDADHAEIEELVADLLTLERSRFKAVFREAEDREGRLRKDVRIAVGMARKHTSAHWDAGRGYVASDDKAFRRFERHRVWGTRPRVHIFRRALPQLAGMVCGRGIDDASLVRLLFNPVAQTAAALMKDEIDLLTRAGVDLSGKSVDRLEWDLRESLQEAVHKAVRGEGDGADEVLAALQIAQAAAAKGYPVDPDVQKVVDHYDELVALLDVERQRRQEIEDELDAQEARAKSHLARVAVAVGGQAPRGRRRVRRALAQLGLDLGELLDEPKAQADDLDSESDLGGGGAPPGSPPTS